MRAASQDGGVRPSSRAAKGALLLASVVIGAYLTAGAGGATGLAWVGWFALVPLFLVIRLWRPAAALLGGALWGGSIYVFSLGQPEAGASGVAVMSLLLSIAVPAAIASGGAWLTRRICFNPFVLASPGC